MRAYFIPFCLLLCGCATARAVTKEALRLTPEGRKIVAQWDRYERLASTFKKFHDSGNIDDKDVTGVLYDLGLLKTRPVHLPSTTKPSRAPDSFPVPNYEGAWQWPLSAGVVSSEFGPRWGKEHKGLDLAADMGVEVYAAADAEVMYAGDKLTGYGNVVILQHDKKTTSLYAHNKKNKVNVGDKVKRGQLIALLGSTGKSTGPHVHFEIRGSKGPVDPRKILPKSRF